MSAIYRYFIYVLDDNIASVVLFQNLGNLKTNATKIPVLVLQKLSLLDSSFLGCFIRKIATICSIPWFSTGYISKSSTRWYILLFIISFVLRWSTQKCRFHKIDMDFEIVASTLKACKNKVRKTVYFQILGSSPPIGKSISQNNKRHSITTNFRAHALYQVEITRKWFKESL